jgi:hypothetical protein
MKLRRLLYIVPLCLVLASCLDPTGPRLPDEDEDPDQNPDTQQLVVLLPGH